VPHRPSQTTIANVLEAESTVALLSTALLDWSPFRAHGCDDSSGEAVRTALRSMYPEKSPDIFNVLRLQQVVKQLSLECFDTANGQRKALCYQAAKRYHVAQKKTVGLYQVFEKSKRIAAKLDRKAIVKSLACPCDPYNKKKRHTCLDAFREQIGAVHRWRVCYYALPYGDRQRRLATMFSDEHGAQMVSKFQDTAAFKMQYFFMQRPVCKEAFQRLTGIDKHSLRRGRTCGTSDRIVDPNALIAVPAFLDGRHARKYLCSRAWLLSYAESHADYNPIDGTMLLPAGRKHHYYNMYKQQCISSGIGDQAASQSVFLEMWRMDCAWIKLRQTHSPFTKCGLCEFLKGCSEATADMQVRQQLLKRLSDHYEFAATQRVQLSLYWKQSEMNPLQLCLMSVDKMDQLKTIFPRFAAMQQADFMKTSVRLRVGIVGCYATRFAISHQPINGKMEEGRGKRVEGRVTKKEEGKITKERTQ
jgi:hypothetical protein